LDEKKPAENGDYQFLREKIVSKKKGRIKKVLFVTLGTVVLAAVFGIVARFMFMVSDVPIGRLLGLSPTPTISPTPTRTPALSPTARPATPTPMPTPTPTPQVPFTPTEAPSATPTEVPSVTPTEAASDNPIEQLKEMYEKLGGIAK
jgi:hypothetical protein